MDITNAGIIFITVHTIIFGTVLKLIKLR
jgi:hypothetical protein